MRTPAILLLALSAPLLARAQGAKPDLRARLAAVERDLDRAVGSLSSGAHVFGLPARTRSYYLDGQGPVFVLPPRVLGVGSARLLFRSEGAGIDWALQHLEEGLHRIESPEVRAELGRTLADLRHAGPGQEPADVEPTPPTAGLRQALEAARDREEAARRSAAEASEAARASREASGPEGSAQAEALERAAAQAEGRRRAWAREVRSREQQLRALEAQVEAFRLEAEQARREAEQQLDVVTHQIQLRFGGGGEGTVVVETSEGAPPPAPWAFWYETSEQAAPAPEDVVAQVRQAIGSVLARGGASLGTLGPEDVVSVVVDFVPAALGPSSRPERTLVVRVGAEALRQHAAGRLSDASLRERIEYSEY